MDFVSDALFDGRRFRLLPVLDHFTHECLQIVVDQSLRADDVAEAVARWSLDGATCRVVR